ncbi:RagB/SusD family nutrient uptake outer membrane protein, partial [Escherichia coli]|nr:RagB/SusD family nutrient uptake outer membrane protein [Escherichia coli]
MLANGSQFKGSMIETYVGGSDYASIAEGGSPTGYFLRKYIQESTNLNPNTPVSNKHHWIVYRYAETLLTYAESMIEAFGDPDYTDETY